MNFHIFVLSVCDDFFLGGINNFVGAFLVLVLLSAHLDMFSDLLYARKEEEEKCIVLCYCRVQCTAVEYSEVLYIKVFYIALLYDAVLSLFYSVVQFNDVQ